MYKETKLTCLISFAYFGTRVCSEGQSHNQGISQLDHYPSYHAEAPLSLPNSCHERTLQAGKKFVPSKERLSISDSKSTKNKFML